MSISSSVPLLEMYSLAGTTGSNIRVTLPVMSGAIHALSQDLAQINITLGWPSLQQWTADIRGGGTLAITLPSLTMGGEYLAGVAATIAAEINLFEVLLEASGENLGQFDLNLPQFDSAINVQSEIIGHISGALPLLKLSGTGKTGAVGGIDISLPIVYYDSVLLAQGLIALDITLPAVAVDIYGTYDDVTITYRVLVANTTNFGITEYPSCEYVGMAKFHGDVIAIRNSDLVKVGAALDHDQPIEAALQTGTLDFSNPVWTMPRDVWVTLRSGKKIQLTVKPDELPDEESFSYESENFIPTLRKTRVKLGRGLNSGYYDFMVENISGEYIDIESIHVLSMPIRGKKR
jgi:hypothetical protein